MDKNTPLYNFFYGFKWLTALGTMILGAVLFVFGILNVDVDGSQWAWLFGFFLAWCGHSLKETLKKEQAIRDLNREDDDDDEGPYNTLRPV